MPIIGLPNSMTARSSLWLFTAPSLLLCGQPVLAKDRAGTPVAQQTGKARTTARATARILRPVRIVDGRVAAQDVSGQGKARRDMLVIYRTDRPCDAAEDKSAAEPICRIAILHLQ